MKKILIVISIIILLLFMMHFKARCPKGPCSLPPITRNGITTSSYYYEYKPFGFFLLILFDIYVPFYYVEGTDEDTIIL